MASCATLAQRAPAPRGAVVVATGLALVLALLSAACATVSNHGNTKALPAKSLNEGVKYAGSGRISYYANHFKNRRTASGERYNPEQFTAAHPTLPFGTLLMVKRPKSGRYVIVRVNDRGPHIKGRVLDLSTAAAKRLGIMTRGVAQADYFVVDPRSSLASQL